MITEYSVEIPPGQLKRVRSHHELATDGWTLVADDRLFEDGMYRGELIRPIQLQEDGGVTIYFMYI